MASTGKNAPARSDYPIAMNAIEELRSLLGADGVLSQPQELAPYLTDWRGRYRGSALAVVQPRNTQQVAELVRWCAGRKLAIVPQGGNTGLVGGATPDESGGALVLSTRRINRIRAVDTVNDTLTAEAGCLLAQLQQAAAAHQRLFPLSMASEGSCSIGGNLATNAGGTQVLRYGNARELTLGLEVVLADGSIWDGLRGLRKHNCGYDLKQLFIGAEGTLGIITAATVKLFPAPQAQLACLFAVADLGAAIGLLERARAAGGPALTAFEVISQACVDLVGTVLGARRPLFARNHPWLVLLEWTDHEDHAHALRQCEALGASALQAGAVQDIIVATSLADSASLWAMRERIPEAQARAGGNVKHDIALPLGVMQAFVQETERELLALNPNLQAYVFGHLGDGNLHFNVGARPGTAPASVFALEERINAIVFAAVTRYGGSISAEHGIGQLRRDLAQRTMEPVERQLMQTIKKALDPYGRMNPGKVI